MKQSKCYYCQDKGYATQLVGGTGGYTDFGALKKVQLKWTTYLNIACPKCLKGKRMLKKFGSRWEQLT